MRCTNCNADLPEFYKKCPLCENAATDTPPLIPGIATAEYPRVKTQPKRLNVFPVFLIVWLAVSLVGILLLKLSFINEGGFAAIFMLLPLLWTAIGRPLFVKHYFSGNYILMNFYSLSLAALSFGLASDEKELFSCISLSLVATIIPLSLLAFLLLGSREEIYRASPYAILLTAYSLICAVVFFVITGLAALIWLLPAVSSLVLLLTAKKLSPEKSIQEIKAKFSIQ